MKRLANSALPRSRPIGGMRTSPTKDDTIFPKAPPMMTPTASSATLPRRMNSLNWLSIPRLVRLPPQERGHVEVLFRRAVALGADVGRHAPAPVLGSRGAGAGRALHVHHLTRRLARLLALAEARGDDRDAHLVLQARVDDGAEDDVRLLVRRLLDDTRGLLDLVQRQVRPAGEIDQDAAGVVDGGLVEQRTRDGFLRGVERAMLALADARAHERHAHAGHDGAHVREVEVNLDFADVRTIMAGMGMALMGAGVGKGEHRALDAAQKAVASPLLDETSIDDARGILINFTGGSDLSLHEVEEAARIVQEAAHEEAHIIFGAVIDPSLQDEVRITVIATGFSERKESSQPSGKVVDLPRPARPGVPTTKDWRRRVPADIRAEGEGEPTEEDLDVPAFLRRQAD